MQSLRIVVLVSAVLLLAFAHPALAQGTCAQNDPPGSIFTLNYGIDAAGDIVGSYMDGSGNNHGFLLVGGTYTIVDYPGCQNNYLAGINDLGQAVGGCDASGFGFLYDIPTQTFTAIIIYPGASATFAAGVNSAGTVAGYYAILEKNGQEREYGFELIGTTYSQIAPPRLAGSVVVGITTSGVVIGEALPNLVNFSFNQGKYKQITIPNYPGAQVLGTDPAGDALVGRNGRIGFLYRGKVFRTVDFPGSFSTFATSINSAGVVVGYFTDTHGYHGFSYKPPVHALKK